MPSPNTDFKNFSYFNKKYSFQKKWDKKSSVSFLFTAGSTFESAQEGGQLPSQYKAAVFADKITGQHSAHCNKTSDGCPEKLLFIFECIGKIMSDSLIVIPRYLSDVLLFCIAHLRMFSEYKKLKVFISNGLNVMVGWRQKSMMKKTKQKQL